MASGTIRLLIADDHAMFRESLRLMLEAEPGFRVVGEASHGAELAELAGRVPADIILLDLAMPGGDGLVALRLMDEKRICVPVIVLTGGTRREQILEAVRLGARGVLLKDTPVDALQQAIQTVAAGGSWVPHALMADLIESLQDRRPRPPAGRAPAALTRRESQIVASIADGATNKQIAEQFGLSEQTVKNYLGAIFAKVGVTNRLELAILAVRREAGSDHRSST